MLARAYGVAHVMQAIEKRHQIIILRRKIFCRSLCERDAVSNAGFLRQNLGAFNGRLVVVEPEEFRVRIGLCHHDCGSAVTTSDISYFGASFELLFHALKLWNPIRNEISVIARPEE